MTEPYIQKGTGLGPSPTTNYELHDIAYHRLNDIEAKLASHEEYFETIKAILTKIQADYEARQDGQIS